MCTKNLQKFLVLLFWLFSTAILTLYAQVIDVQTPKAEIDSKLEELDASFCQSKIGELTETVYNMNDFLPTTTAVEPQNGKFSKKYANYFFGIEFSNIGRYNLYENNFTYVTSSLDHLSKSKMKFAYINESNKDNDKEKKTPIVSGRLIAFIGGEVKYTYQDNKVCEFKPKRKASQEELDLLQEWVNGWNRLVESSTEYPNDTELKQLLSAYPKYLLVSSKAIKTPDGSEVAMVEEVRTLDDAAFKRWEEDQKYRNSIKRDIPKLNPEK